MKLSKLGKLLKKTKEATLYTGPTGETQYIGVGAAIYRLVDMPYISDSEQFLAMIDIPVDDRDGWVIHVELDVPKPFRFSISEQYKMQISISLGDLRAFRLPESEQLAISEDGEVQEGADRADIGAVMVQDYLLRPLDGDGAEYILCRNGEMDYILIKDGEGRSICAIRPYVPGSDRQYAIGKLLMDWDKYRTWAGVLEVGGGVQGEF